MTVGLLATITLPTPSATAASHTLKASCVLVRKVTASLWLNGVAMAARCTMASGRKRAITSYASPRSVRSAGRVAAASAGVPGARSTPITSCPAAANADTTLRPRRPALPVTRVLLTGVFPFWQSAGEPGDCNQLHQTVSASGGNVKGSVAINCLNWRFVLRSR
nr:hypothetical protein GCM10020093_050620 [Planobispora longispora]